MHVGYQTDVNKGNNVVSFLAHHATQSPEKTAFIYRATPDNATASMSYADLYNRTQRVATGLYKLGITKGKVVLVFIPLSPELYVTIAALQYLGAIPAFLDSWTDQEHLEHAIRNAQPVGIVAPSPMLERYATLLRKNDVRILVTTEQGEGVDSTCSLPSLYNTRQQLASLAHVAQDDTALITYTTGSSGTPKGANRTHRFLVAQHRELDRLFPYTSCDIDMPVFPVFALNSIACGVTIVLPCIPQESNRTAQIQALVSQIVETKATTLTLSPLYFNGIVAYCVATNTTLPHLRRVLTGGAPISEIDVERFLGVLPDVEVQILYGSTEVEPIAHIEARDMVRIMRNVPTTFQNPTDFGVVVGHIEEDMTYKIINPTVRIRKHRANLDTYNVPHGEIGELIVAGDHVCREYYNDSNAFARTKIVDTTGTIWHRTGDLARIDTHSMLWIVGRSHNIVTWQGTRYFPVRPEIALKQIHGVANAAYLNRASEGKGEVLAVVSPVQATLTEQERMQLADNVRDALHALPVPVHTIVIMPAIPMDVRHHSKVDYSALRTMLQ